MITLEPADVVLMRTSSKLGRAVRWATREDGEEPTVVNHAGAIVGSAPLRSAALVEAVGRGVVRRPLWDHYTSTGDALAIYRARNLSTSQRMAIARFLERAVGDRYGRWRLVLHVARRVPLVRRVLDWLTPLEVRREEWVCSYLVAAAYAHVGLDFGMHRVWATPDDIWDFCQLRADIYELVYPLGTLDQERIHATTTTQATTPAPA